MGDFMVIISSAVSKLKVIFFPSSLNHCGSALQIAIALQFYYQLMTDISIARPQADKCICADYESKVEKKKTMNYRRNN